jgi:hypothetical protein
VAVAEVFEYAIVRVVPRVEREEFLNVGVIVWCQAYGYLAARTVFDAARLAILDPDVELAAVRAHVEALPAICAGGASAGVAGTLTPGERFRWLTSPRSTAVQTSAVHSGLTDDPVAELDRLTALLVAVPRAAR